MKIEVTKGEVVHPFLKEQGGHVVYVSTKGRALDSRNGKWKNLHNNGNGYYFFLQGHTPEGKSIREYIHRAVATCFLDNPEGLPQVNHINLDKTDNSVDNLEWISGSRNIRHAHESGAMVKRTSNGQINILTEEQVIDLYTCVLAGMGISEKARQMGIPRTTASSIVNKRSRADITDRLDQQWRSTFGNQETD